MNGCSKDTDDITDLLLDGDGNSSGGGDPCSFVLGDLDVPEAFETTPDDTPAPAYVPMGPVSGAPSASVADVYDIDNMSGSDDGMVPGKPSSLAGAAVACGVGAATGLGLIEGATYGGPVAEKPSSLAAAGFGGDEGAASGGGLVPHRNPPRAASASRKLPSGEEGSSGGADGAGSPSESRSSRSSRLSGDATDENPVHSSDGNEFDSDGSMRSVIGSINGEGSAMSDSSYAPSAFDDADDSGYSPSSTSTSPSAHDMSCTSTEGNRSVVSCQGAEDETPKLERPIGMMLAKADPDDPEMDFVCSKVRQKYERVVDGKPCELFEVVFKDGKREEYGRDNVFLYRDNYEAYEGTRGCAEFFFKV